MLSSYLFILFFYYVLRNRVLYCYMVMYITKDGSYSSRQILFSIHFNLNSKYILSASYIKYIYIYIYIY